MAREEMEQAIKDLGITVDSVFVPWSKSRSYDPKGADWKFWSDARNLNWKVTLKLDGRAILTTDYSAGIAHCPSYKPHAVKTMDYNEEIIFEVQNGRRAKRLPSAGRIHGGDAILPDTADVVWALVQDSDVLTYGTFEEWADSLGYDQDSRKAEATYRACLEIALKLQSSLGHERLQRLQEAAQDY